MTSHHCRKCNESMWGAIYDGQCNACIHNENNTLRAKLEKAEKVVEAAKKWSYSTTQERGKNEMALLKTIKDYRGETK